jgi:hypothetical protein
MVYTRVLEARAERLESSNLSVRTKLRRLSMKVYENIVNKEQFVYEANPDTKTVDGIEYIKLSRVNITRSAFIRKDTLKVVESKTKIK